MLLIVSSFGESLRQIAVSERRRALRGYCCLVAGYSLMAGKTTKKVEPSPIFDSTQMRP